jgi:hypothetical protein
MIQFTKPVNLNGAELIQELIDNGIEVIGKPFLDGNDILWLDIAEKDETKAKTVVDAHDGSLDSPELTIEEKLANAGVSIEELKSALGL